MNSTNVKGNFQPVEPSLHPAFPFYNCTIPAGFPSPASDYIEDTIDLNELLIKTPSATFFVRVEGESMINAFIPPKALLIVDRSIHPGSGDVIIAVVNGEFTVKRLRKSFDAIILEPANEKFPSITITEEMNFQVWGVVSKIIIDPKDVPCSL